MFAACAAGIASRASWRPVARADVPVGSVISEYVDVSHAFDDKRESGVVNGLLGQHHVEASGLGIAQQRLHTGAQGLAPPPEMAGSS